MSYPRMVIISVFPAATAAAVVTVSAAPGAVVTGPAQLFRSMALPVAVRYAKSLVTAEPEVFSVIASA